MRLIGLALIPAGIAVIVVGTVTNLLPVLVLGACIIVLGLGMAMGVGDKPHPG